MNDFDNDDLCEWSQLQVRRTLLIKSLRWEQEFFKKIIWAELGKLTIEGIIFPADSFRFYKPGRNVAVDFSTSPEFYFYKQNEHDPKISWLNRKTKQLLDIHNLIESISKNRSNLKFPPSIS